MNKNSDEKKLTKVVINWYPGHMVKTKNDIKSKLKLIDIVIEVLDARIPVSSHNKEIDEIFVGKPKIVVLNKSDLSDMEETKKWKEYYLRNGCQVVIMNTNNPNNVAELIVKINEMGKEIYLKKNENKSIEINPIYRVAIVGIPNVGKSTLINKLAKKESVKVGNKPGVTLKNTWIRIANNIDLLDTPGILWPKLDENNAGVKLALTGNIKQEILDEEELACLGVEYLKNNDKHLTMLKEKYKIDDEDLDLEPYDLLEIIGKKRGCIISGGNVDTVRAAKIFLDELKNGKIGNISFEVC